MQLQMQMDHGLFKVLQPLGIKRTYYQNAFSSKEEPCSFEEAKRAKRQVQEVHGGKEPVSVKTETIDVGDASVRLVLVGLLHMSPKETGDDGYKQNIHHTNEDNKDGELPDDVCHNA